MTDSESPTGRYAISISSWEARMSHWIDTPTLTDRHSGEVLLSFQNGNWSLNSSHWINDSVVVLTLRKYPGAHIPTELSVTVDCLNKTAAIGDTRVPALDRLEAALDHALSPLHPAHTPTHRKMDWSRALRRFLGLTNNEDV